MRCLVSCALLLLATQARAATFCVDTVQELGDALTTAQSNGENDLIRVVAGTYALNDRLTYMAAEDFSLKLVGGYFSAGTQCVLWFPDAANTVLDGGGQAPLLVLHGASGSGAISVGHFTFRNGIGAGGIQAVFVGGYAGYGGEVTVEDNVFTNLAGREDGGYTAVQISVDQGSLVVRNNVFAANTSESGIQPVDILVNAAPIAPDAPAVNPNGAFNNNTVSGNVGTAFAIGVRGSGFWSAANNVMWGNENIDLILGSHVALYNNDIESYQGIPDSEDGAVSVDPRFVDAAGGDYRLRGDSPLIDQGIGDPYGEVGTFDVAGDDRVVFGAVDIGAHELQEAIFLDGFD